MPPYGFHSEIAEVQAAMRNWVVKSDKAAHCPAIAGTGALGHIVHQYEKEI
jgi:hypothetical protein